MSRSSRNEKGERTAARTYSRLPVSVSIETQGGLMLKVAEKGDLLPAKICKIFSTQSDVPEVVAVRLFVGERPFAENNLFIGEVKLEGIQRLSNGRPVISLIISIDAQCGIDIEATDEGSLKNAKSHIDGDWVPSETKIDIMLRDAADNRAADSLKQNRAVVIQRARQGVCRAELKCASLKGKLSSKKIKAYRQRIGRLKAKLKKISPEDMTELDEKSITRSINELSVGIDAE